MCLSVRSCFLSHLPASRKDALLCLALAVPDAWAVDSALFCLKLRAPRSPSGQWLSTQVINHFPIPAIRGAPDTAQPLQTRLLVLARVMRDTP